MAVITGTSSGIGEATARGLPARGAKVMLGARRTDRLQLIADDISSRGVVLHWCQLDVTQALGVKESIDDAHGWHGKIDVLINNAGVIPLSPLDQLKVEEWDRMIDVNIRGVLYGIAADLPIMKAQPRGQIINLPSIGGHTVAPTAAVYCATKFAGNAILEGLRQEVGGDSRVTVVSRGVTISELAESISDDVGRETMREFRRIAIDADATARAISYAIEQPDDVDVSEIIVRPTASLY